MRALSFNHFDNLYGAVALLAADFIKKLVQRANQLQGTYVGINTTQIFLAVFIL